MKTAGIFPILLVDDEQHILHSLESVLRFADIRKVRAVDDSYQVLPILEQEEFGVVLLDLIMRTFRAKNPLRPLAAMI